MGFWIAALAVSALVALALVRPLAVGRGGTASRAAHEERVFRDQLVEIDRDLERGVLAPDEAASARVEVSRRLLAAAEARERTGALPPAPKRLSLGAAAALVVATPALAALVYMQLGAPDLPDQPLALRAQGVRPDQAAAEARLAPTRPLEDGEPASSRLSELESRRATGRLDRADLYELAQRLAAHGRYGEAWRAYDELVGEGRDAPASILAALGESMVLAAGGYVSPEAEDTFDTALRRDPANPVARYYLGAAYAQTRRPQSALDVWSRLLAESPPDAPWAPMVRERISALVEQTGLPAPETAARVSDEEERRRAILGMVRSLDERLRSEPGAPEDWAQLVGSYRVLGMEKEAAAARERARGAFENDAEALASLEAVLQAAEARAAEAGTLAERAAALEDRLRDGMGSPDEWAQLAALRGALGGPRAAEAFVKSARDALADDPAATEAFETRFRELAPPVPDGSGPAAQDLAAAEMMTEADREEMVRGMVDGLRDRLYATGGSGAEWARLVRSLAVLNRKEEAKAAYERARPLLEGDPVGLARLEQAAEEAGAAP